MRIYPALVLSLILVSACERAEVGTPGPDTPAVVTLTNDPIAWAFDAPPTWDDRVTMVDESVAPGALHYSARAFIFSPSDTSLRPQSLLSVLVFNNTNWARVTSEQGPPPGDTIVTADGRVYVAALPQSNPFETGSADAQAFDSMLVDMTYVRTAFRRLP